jgi:hypothetical protein
MGEINRRDIDTTQHLKLTLVCYSKVSEREKVKNKIYFFIDFKKINEKTKIEYIISTIVKLYAKTCGTKIFSKLDLATVFHQILVVKES